MSDTVTIDIDDLYIEDVCKPGQTVQVNDVVIYYYIDGGDAEFDLYATHQDKGSSWKPKNPLALLWEGDEELRELTDDEIKKVFNSREFIDLAYENCPYTHDVYGGSWAEYNHAIWRG